MKDEPFIDINDLAKFLKVKRQTAYHFVVTQNIPHYRIGRLIRFKLSEVKKWMETNRAKPLNVPYEKGLTIAKKGR